MGLFDVSDACPESVFGILTPNNLKIVPSGTMFEQDLYGLTASVLSLASNLVATALIWCKAWYVLQWSRTLDIVSGFWHTLTYRF